MKTSERIWSAEYLALLPPTVRSEILNNWSRDEKLFGERDWPFWARADQLACKTNWSTWLLLGGRGSGKTRAGAEWVRAQMEGATPLSAGTAARCALVAETFADAREVMVDGDSGLLALEPSRLNVRPLHEPTRHRLVWPNGAVAYYFSAEDPDALRGPQFSIAWCDELCKWRYNEETWDMLQFGLRLGNRPRQVVTTTPRPIKLLKKLMSRSDTVTTVMNTRDNRANLPRSFFDHIIRRYEGTRLGRQELDGEILDDNPEALWHRDQIEKLRVNNTPDLKRIVVAVDPAVTSTENSDECGIVVAALGVDEKVYVLADKSVGRRQPSLWASRAISAYHNFEADRIVGEVNQGGDLVKTLIHQIDPAVPFKAVRATRNKWVRAEPVAALYERGLVHHVGALPHLEDQMCEFEPGLSGSSYDRLDALVWACTDLIIGSSLQEPKIHRL